MLEFNFLTSVHQCEMCEKEFARMTDLEWHIGKVHKSSSGEKTGKYVSTQ